MPEAAPVLESCQRYPHLKWRDLKTGAEHPLACKSWKCPYCAPNLAKFYRYRLGAWAEALDLSRFMTLTLDPSKAWRKGEWKQEVVRKAARSGLHPNEPGFRQWYSWKYVKRAWNIFLTNLRRRYPNLEYIAVMEPQKNGVMHLHIFVNQYIPSSKMVYLWKRSGGGYRCRIEKVRSLKKTAWYVSNYVTKIAKIDQNFYPDRARRFTTSRGLIIQMYPKDCNVSKENPVLDRDNLPWQDCFPDEDFENCKKCRYKSQCRAHPSGYELICNGHAIHAPPAIHILMELITLHKPGYNQAALANYRPERFMLSCNQLPVDERPCSGCLHVNRCRILYGQPEMPYYFHNHGTGERTKWNPIKEHRTRYDPRTMQDTLTEEISIWKRSKST